MEKFKYNDVVKYNNPFCETSAFKKMKVVSHRSNKYGIVQVILWDEKINEFISGPFSMHQDSLIKIDSENK